MSKTYTGGYRLVSLAFIDLALASTAIAVAGLGDALGIKSRKRIVLTDIVVSGEKKNDLSVQVKKDGNNYVIEDVYGYDLSIDASGNVTSSEHSSGGAGGTKLYKHIIRFSVSWTYNGQDHSDIVEFNVLSDKSDAFNLSDMYYVFNAFNAGLPYVSNNIYIPMGTSPILENASVNNSYQFIPSVFNTLIGSVWYANYPGSSIDCLTYAADSIDTETGLMKARVNLLSNVSAGAITDTVTEL